MIFKFLLVCFLFFLLMVFLLGFSFVRGLKNLLFGSPNKQQPSRSSRQSQKQNSSQKGEKKDEVTIVRKLMKDAEYVDYEEIKD